MNEAYEARGGNVLAVEEVPASDTHKYGVVAVGDPMSEASDRVRPVHGMVEKPPQGTAPSNLIIMGRYILQPEIFDILSRQEKGAGNEIQLTDAMKTLMDEQPFTAVRYKGRSFDCGSKVGFLTANIAFGLERPDIADALRAELEKLM